MSQGMLPIAQNYVAKGDGQYKLYKHDNGDTLLEATNASSGETKIWKMGENSVFNGAGVNVDQITIDDSFNPAGNVGSTAYLFKNDDTTVGVSLNDTATGLK